MDTTIAWPANVDTPEHSRALIEALVSADINCALCTQPLGEAKISVRVATVTDRDWTEYTYTHRSCQPPITRVANTPDDSPTQYRVACAAFPDGRAALVVNPDADRITLNSAGEPVMADALLSSGWVSANTIHSKPAVVPGWIRVDGHQAELAGALGIMNFDVDPRWSELAHNGPGDEIPVIALLAASVDRWNEAQSWDDIVALLNGPHAYAGLAPLQ